MRHLPPLHRSARVSGPEPVRLSPNAVQTVRAGQSTAAKKISWPPPGLGVACTCHLLPFHRSASVLTGVWFPTAVHAEAEVQATPLRAALGPAGAGLKVGTIRHLTPFHRSASVPSDSPVAGSNSLPTAMQDDRDVQATLFRSRLEPFCRTGISAGLLVAGRPWARLLASFCCRRCPVSRLHPVSIPSPSRLRMGWGSW